MGFLNPVWLWLHNSDTYACLHWMTLKGQNQGMQTTPTSDNLRSLHRGALFGI